MSKCNEVKRSNLSEDSSLSLREVLAVSPVAMREYRQALSSNEKETIAGVLNLIGDFVNNNGTFDLTGYVHKLKSIGDKKPVRLTKRDELDGEPVIVLGYGDDTLGADVFCESDEAYRGLDKLAKYEDIGELDSIISIDDAVAVACDVFDSGDPDRCFGPLRRAFESALRKDRKSGDT